MDANRVVSVVSSTERGSGYVIVPRLVLTSAHVSGTVGTAVTVFAVGEGRRSSGTVTWRGTAGGRDDAALVEVDDPGWCPRTSGGTRQKLSLILGELHAPDLLLLDEPYQGFDQGTYLDFWQQVWRWREAGKAVVLVTHVLHELDQVDHVVELRSAQAHDSREHEEGDRPC